MTDPAPLYLVLLSALLCAAVFVHVRDAARRRVFMAAQSGGPRPHSRSRYHGALAALAAAAACVLVLGGGLALRDGGSPLFDALWMAAIKGAGVAAGWAVARRSTLSTRARPAVERIIRGGLAAVSALAVLITLGIVATLLFEALLFFADVSVIEFVFGTQWSPQTAIREGGAGQSGQFGAVPVFAGTLLVTAVALVVAVPTGLMIAIYLSEYASRRTRALVKPMTEVLAGIPPVVYGVFALLTIGPAIRAGAGLLGLSVPVQSALAAGLVLGLMIVPLISSLSDDVINAVPQSLRDGALALGATKSETVRRAVLPSALPGILSAVLLSVSRAVGETMIVVLAAGRAATLSANPLDSVTTVTAQIVALLTGDQVFDSAKTRAAFALGLTLFALTLILNVVALVVVRRYRERYA